MTSLLKRNLHQMVDYAESDKIISACIGREDVCRFLLHSYMDYMTDNGLYDSSFQVLIDWSQQLNVYVDDKEWKVKKEITSISTSSTSPIKKERSSFKRRKKSSKKRNIINDNVPITPLTITQTKWIDENESENGSDHERKVIFLNRPRTKSNDEYQYQYQYQRRWTNESEISQRTSIGSISDCVDVGRVDGEHKKKNSISIGDHDKNLIVAKHAKNILNNIDEDEKYSISLSITRTITNGDVNGYDDDYNYNYISKLSHSTWMLIGIYLDTSSKAAGLGLVSREMNLLCNHPLCWKKLKIKIDNLTKVSLNVMRRLFKYLTRFELNWDNPETPLSLLYDDDNISIPNDQINGYMALKYSKEIELFFKNLSLICNDSLHTFKLSMHGGPYRLANSAPTSVKIFQTETLLRLIFSNFNNLRKFKMDAYNLIAVDVFISLLKKYSPNLQFFESQIVVYNRQTQRVILENPVILNDINILPSTLKHLCLPLLADDSWIINQHLPNLEYLFFFGYTRSSGYALHENFLSIRCLDYIAGQKSQFPNCPKIKVIEIALRQNDYLPIILRPIIRKLFLRCQFLENVKLATAGNLDLAQSLYSSLYASNLQVCHVFAKDEGRPEKPIGVVEFRRNYNYKFIHLSVPNITHYENEETISEMAIGGRLRG